MQTLAVRARVVSILFVCLFAPQAAAGEPSEPGRSGWLPRGLGFGLRAGYALPAGLVADDAEEPYLYDLYSGLFSLWLDAGYRFESNIEVGPWVQLARAQIRGICDADACSGFNTRLGVLADYHFRPQGPTNPWLGLGLGYEWTSYRVPAGELTYDGPEVSLQGGFDRRLAGPLWAGMFFSLSMGRYDTVGADAGNGKVVAPLRDKSPHFWLTIGARLKLGDVPDED